MDNLRSFQPPSNLSLKVYRAFWSAVDLLYPPVCAGCKKPGARWCQSCEDETKVIDQRTACPRCGRPNCCGAICDECTSDPLPLAGIRTWAVYDGRIRQAIHSLKYANNLSLGDVFSQYLVSLLRQTNWKVDLVVPVPTGLKKRSERGYNQANQISLAVALGIGIRNSPAALKKSRNTPSQVDLSSHERRLNLRGAFWADPDLVSQKRILVIDDVITTGSTLRYCAEALTQAGADVVYAATVARSLLHTGDST